MAQATEDYSGIDFEGLKDSTGLEQDEVKVLKICFNMFDFKKQGFLSGEFYNVFDTVIIVQRVPYFVQECAQGALFRTGMASLNP